MLAAAPLANGLALQGKFDALARQLDDTYAAVREGGKASAQRDCVTHRHLGRNFLGIVALAVLVIGGGWKLWSG